MRHLQQSAPAVERLAAVAAAAATPPPASGVHTDTFLILAAVLCFLLCVVGLAFVARCWRLCNPSAYSVDAEPAEAAPPCKKGLKKKALQALPVVSFEVAGGEGGQEEEEEEAAERPECAICLNEFARGDEVRLLPPCGHRFHAACVDVWLLSSSTCPSCRRALVVAPAALTAATDPTTAQTSTDPVAGERRTCEPRPSMCSAPTPCRST